MSTIISSSFRFAQVLAKVSIASSEAGSNILLPIEAKRSGQLAVTFAHNVEKNSLSKPAPRVLIESRSKMYCGAKKIIRSLLAEKGLLNGNREALNVGDSDTVGASEGSGCLSNNCRTKLTTK